MPESAAKVVFHEVFVGRRRGDDAGLRNASFEVFGGELMSVALDDGCRRTPLADAAMGLAELDWGAVFFNGESWADMHPDRAAACRGRIGRVFESRSWVSNLTVSENVLLAQLNHSRRSRAELEERAERLARELGLPGLPRERSHRVAPGDLRRAEWVRALLGDPDLIVLEQPAQGVPENLLSPLDAAVARGLERGAAVLWIADGGAPGGLGAVRRRSFSLRGSDLVSL